MRLFDHLGHLDLLVSALGGVGQRVLLAQLMGGNGPVLADHVEDVLRVGGWLDTLDIDLVQLLHVLENMIELVLVDGNLLVGETNAGQVGNIANIHEMGEQAVGR